MTTLLAKAFAEAEKLPPDEQDAFARWMLEELQEEERWSNSFANSLDILEQMADEALEEYRAGKTEILDPDTL
jgi:hypothetical protein